MTRLVLRILVCLVAVTLTAALGVVPVGAIPHAELANRTGPLPMPPGPGAPPSVPPLPATGSAAELPDFEISADTNFMVEELAWASVSLSAPAATPVTFDFTTVNGSALAGVDYEATAGTMTIPVGRQFVYVEVRLLRTPIGGPSTEFTVLVSNVLNAIPTSTVATITVEKGLHEVVLYPNVGLVTEVFADAPNPAADNALHLYMYRTHYEDVTVTLNSTDGTAVAGDDYTALVNKVVTIPAGAWELYVPLDIASDGAGEFTVRITAITNAVISEDDSVVVEIQPTFGDAFTVSDGEATPGAGTTTIPFTVTLLEPRDVDTGIQHHIFDITTTGDDYERNDFNESIIIPAGQLNGVINVVVKPRFANDDVIFGLQAYGYPNIRLSGGHSYGTIKGTAATGTPVEAATSPVSAGESFGNGSAPTAGIPAVARVRTPKPGIVSVGTVPSTSTQVGFNMLSTQVNVTAPLASAADPLSVTFTVDGALLAQQGTSLSTAVRSLSIFRDGARVANCTDATGKAAPDPCVSGRKVVNGDIETTVLSSHGSQWTFGVPAATTGNFDYRLAAADGGIFTYGDAGFYGSTGHMRLNQPIVGAASTPDGKGYWLVASDGGVFTFGNAQFYGSTGSMTLNKPIVDLVPTISGDGYRLVASDGGVFTFGTAEFQGSTGAMVLNSPVVAGAAAAAGDGYWLFAADGGVFSFGGAAFAGSAGSLKLNSPVVGGGATPTGNGYWLVGADGGVFTYGSAGFFGSAGADGLSQPIVGMTPTADGQGYWLAAADGGVFTFGSAGFSGSAATGKINQPVVAITAA